MKIKVIMEKIKKSSKSSISSIIAGLIFRKNYLEFTNLKIIKVLKKVLIK
jgi:hypothetical protein